VAGGAARRPQRPGWNRAVAWTALWMVPLGLVASGLVPDYRVPFLHVTFIGGFALLAFSVATHVTASHLELPVLRDGRSPVVAVVAVTMLLALSTRVVADATSGYFLHLGAAAFVWIAGSVVWLVALLPAWLRPPE
ncbi:MAG TPA: NnrS family protein, partial [Candidatus Limnocylindria bacterium]|nr:NnrS family protein [Candidatus Limnocylindria bacterium]